VNYVKQYFFSMQVLGIVIIGTAQIKWAEEDAKIRTLLDGALKVHFVSRYIQNCIECR
jgi:hypothetical protein